jgi:polyferredoxin
MIQEKRTFIQTLSLLALHSSWGLEFKYVCNPVLSCHSCALAWFACPVGVFVHYSGYQVFPLFALGTVLLVGVLFGRLLCGWVCPFGFLQDLLHKIPSPKLSLPGWTSNVKYAVLISTVFLIPYFLGEATAYSFCRFCPASALQVTVPNLIGGAAISSGAIVKLSILAVVLAFVVFSERAFCKTLCPIGALLAPLNYLSFWAVKIPDAECLECKKCDKACPTAVTPSIRIEQGVAPNRALDCIVCHQCQPVCPQRGPSPRVPKPRV